MKLNNKNNIFKQNNTNKFNIHISNVEKPYKLRIFHDDTNLISK